MVSLSALEDYAGGLEVLDAEGNLSSQRTVRLGSGDAVFHSFNLQHSVNVTRGERWSLVLWFDTTPACRGATVSW